MDPDFTPCDGCAQPNHCGGRFPDDDKHRPGQLRGCFGAKAKGIQITTCAGKTTHYGTDVVPNPAWEKGVAHVMNHGRKVPFLDSEGLPIHVKQYGERRSEYEGIRERQAHEAKAIAEAKTSTKD